MAFNLVAFFFKKKYTSLSLIIKGEKIMNAKISTIFKTSILAVAVLMIAFMFSACGGNGQFKKVKVDTDGDYQTSNLQALEQILEADEADLKGLRMTINMSIETEMPGYEAPVQIDTNATALTRFAVNNETTMKTEQAFKIEAKANGQKQTMTIYMITTIDKTTNLADVETYYSMKIPKTENTKAETIKYKTILEDVPAYDIPEFDELPIDMILEEMLPNAENLQFIGDNATSIELATEGNTSKIKVVLPMGPETNATFFYIYKDGAFSQFAIENFEMGGQKVNVLGEAWDGEIDFPNFDDYVEMSEDMF